MTRNTQFLINVLLTLIAYFTLCTAIIAVTHSGYCRCGYCEDCKLRRGDEEMTMTTMWPKVALFNYFAVEMPFVGEATARRLPLDWVSSQRSGLVYGSTNPEHDELAAKRFAQRLAERTKRSMP
jgi:hypothetical protein